MIVIYTAVFGRCDDLKPAPKEGADLCVCFTDDPRLRVAGWEMRPYKVEHPRRDSRKIRTESDLLFPEADAVVWIDASSEFTDFPAFVRDAGDAEVAACHHPERNNCWDEAAKTVELGQESPAAMQRQLDDFRAEGFDPVRLCATGLTWRRHTPRVIAFNRLFWQCHEKYGINEQIFFDYCVWKSGVDFRQLRGHYKNSPYMKYHLLDHRRRRRGYDDTRLAG